MSDEPKKPKRWYMLVEVPDELKRNLAKVAKQKDWSLRKAAKHAIEEYVQREAKA